ncbi:VOC family protein [Ideonella sp. DXS29W]|uniref:VOC family protein n=1 Tax=Ideonella lacteola TaxID=2984193 RepID=A0ABU9BLS6_9BURK
MKPTPADWPRISSCLNYRDAAKAIDWLCDAFGFEVRLKVEGEGGRIEHSELTYGEGLIMVGQEREEQARFGTRMLSPLSAGGITQSLMIYVDDVDAHCEQARRAGARIISEPSLHDYGDDYWADRSYGALDLEGHMWWISERVRG